MSTLQTLLLVFQVIVAITLIGFILIQHGKGADAGAAFGSGASATVFGSRGSSNFFSKATAVLAILFLGNSLFLGYLASNAASQPSSLLEHESSVMFDAGAPEQAGADSGAAPAATPETMPQEMSEQPATDMDQQAADETPLVPQQ